MVEIFAILLYYNYCFLETGEIMDEVLKSLSKSAELVSVDSAADKYTDINANLSVINYLRYAYIDLLISKNMAPEELKILFDRYLAIMNSYEYELNKKYLCSDYSKTKMNMLFEMINLMEFYLKKYGVLSLHIDYGSVIQENVSNYEATLEDGECLKRILRNDELSEE